MGLSANFNPGQFEFSLRQIGDKAVKGMAERMRKTIITMRDLARDYAPRKSGDLESAIEYALVKDGRRNSFVLFVDLDKIHGSKASKTVGDYAYLMEEQLRPYGRKGKAYKLGRISLAKAATGKKVGGRFLARAIEETTKDLMQQLAGEVQKVTRSSSSRIIPMDTPARPELEDTEE